MSFAATGAASSWGSTPWKAAGFCWKSYVGGADRFQYCSIRNNEDTTNQESRVPLSANQRGMRRTMAQLQNLNNHISYRALSLVIGVLLSATTFAQTAQNAQNWVSQQLPTNPNYAARSIKYSGIAMDPSGAKIKRGVHGLTASIYDSQQNGMLQWSEIQNIQVESDGSFSIVIGGTQLEGIPPSVFTTTSSRYLGLQFDSLPEQARMLIVAVPLAVKAADADLFGGKPISEFAMLSDLNSVRVANNQFAKTSASNTFKGNQAVSGIVSADSVSTPFLNANSAALGAANISGGLQAQNIWAKDAIVATAAQVTGRITAGTFAGDGTNVKNVDAQKLGGSQPEEFAKLATVNTFSKRQVFSEGARVAATGIAEPGNQSGYISNSLDIVASAFNTQTSAAQDQIFRWQAEPVSSNSANPSGKLNLLFGTDEQSLKPTGFSVDASGNVNFAAISNLSATQIQGQPVSPTIPTAGQVLAWDPKTSSWKPYSEPTIDVIRDCGAVGDGTTDDGGSINSCLKNNVGKHVYAGQLKSTAACTYYSTVTINIPSGTSLEGDGAQFGGGGTVFCFPAGVTGFKANAYSRLTNIFAKGSEDASTSSASLIVPSAASLSHRYQLSIDTLARAVGTITATFAPGTNCWYKANQIISVSGVSEDVTFNGTYYVASARCGPAYPTRSVTWTQTGGPDVLPFSPAAGFIDVATTGTSTADGVLLSGNLSVIDNVMTQAFGRDGFHFSSTVESDDVKVQNSSAYGNRAAGMFISGNNQKNTTFHFAAYFNTLNAIFDRGFLGDEHYSPQASYNGTGPGLGAGPAQNIASISRTNGVITFTISNASFAVGNAVFFEGVGDVSFNTRAGTVGCYIATAAGGTYTCTQPGYNLANTTSSDGTVRAASATELNNSLAAATGVYAIGLNNFAGNWALYSPYDEGGQPQTQLNSAVWVTNPHSGNGVDPNWPGVVLSTTGSASPTLQSASFTYKPNFDTASDFQVQIGNTADQLFTWNFLDHTGNNSLAEFLLNPTGDVFGIYDGSYSASAVRRFGFSGTNKKDGNTYLNSRGATTVDINFSGGTGGTRFGDGSNNPVASVDATGKGTFSGGVQPARTGGTITWFQKAIHGSLDLPSVAAAACTAEITEGITGAALGDSCSVASGTAVEAGGFFRCAVTTTNEVKWQFCNLSGGNIDRASDTYTIRVIR